MAVVRHSAVNCLLSSTARGAEGLQVHHHEIIILHITHLFYENRLETWGFNTLQESLS